MAVLKRGSSGPDVLTLQSTLKQLGFDPNGVDGTFGPGTEAAVKAFQQSKGLTPDGMVGPDTMAALQSSASVAGAGVAAAAAASASTAATAPVAGGTCTPTSAQVSKMFPGVPMSNIETNLPFVLDALNAAGLGDKNMVLMALATIRAVLDDRTFGERCMLFLTQRTFPADFERRRQAMIALLTTEIAQRTAENRRRIARIEGAATGGNGDSASL